MFLVRYLSCLCIPDNVVEVILLTVNIHIFTNSPLEFIFADLQAITNCLS